MIERRNHSSTGESPQAEPAPTPLVSAAERSISNHPTIHIPEGRLYAVTEHAHHIADNWQGTHENHASGLLGEDALAHHLGIKDELDVEVYADGGDGGIDLQYQGATIDVKTVGRHRSNPALTVNAYKPLTADYYALVSRISKSDFRLIGYAPRWFVANAPTLTDGNTPYHLVDQEYLFPFINTIS